MADTRDRWAAAILGDPGISDGCARTAWAIREYANRDGATTVGLATLARDTSRAVRTVERHVELLRDRGYLLRRPGAGMTTRGGTTALTELRIPSDPPTAGSGLNPPTAGSDPPTAGTESPDRRRQKVPTELCRGNHIEPLNQRAGARANGSRAPAPATEARRRVDIMVDELLAAKSSNHGDPQ